MVGAMNKNPTKVRENEISDKEYMYNDRIANCNNSALHFEHRMC